MKDIQALCRKGQRAYQRGYYQNATHHFNQALHLTNDLTGEHLTTVRQKLLYDLNLSISMTYCGQRDNTQATQYCDQALNIANKMSDLLGIAKCYDEYGEIKMMQNSFNKASKDFEKSLQLKLQVVGDNDINIADTYRAIGKLHLYRMELPQAKEMLDKSLTIRQRVLGDYDAKIAQLYHDIGDWYELERKPKDALAMYQKSLGIVLITTGKKNLEVAKIYCSIGWIYGGYLKKWQDARTKFEKALKLQLEIIGENSLEVALTYHYIAKLHYKENDTNHSITLCLKALRIQSNLQANYCLSIANSYTLLGHCHNDENDHKLALELFEKALEIKTRLFGEKNLSVASIYDSLAKANIKMNDIDKAFLMASRSMKIRQDIVNKNSRYLAYSYLTFAECAEAGNEYSKAINDYKKALKILQDVEGGNTTLQIANIYYNIGWCYRYQNSLIDHIHNEEMYVDIRKQIVGENDIEMAHSYRSIGMSYYDLQQFDKALACFQKSLEIIQLKGTNNSFNFEIYADLASTYQHLKRNKDAISMYEKALKYIIPIYGEFHNFRRNIYLNLEMIYREENNHDEADNSKKLANSIERGIRSCRRSKEPLQGMLFNH